MPLWPTCPSHTNPQTGRENLSYHYEFHKQEGIKNTKEGKGKWKSELASNSEAGVSIES